MEFTDTKSLPFGTATGNSSPQLGVTTVNPLEDPRLAQLASSQAPNSLSTPQDAASLLTGTDSARIFAGTEKADQIRIKAGATAGTITVESLNGTFASVTFAIPTTSLTINSGAGADTITVDSLPGFTAPLTIDDTDDVILNNITVVGNLNVKAGNSIKVVDGVIIASQGDVNLDVTNRVELNFGSAVLKQKQSNAAIDIGNATINGRNVSITTDAATTKTAKLDKNLVYDTRATVLGDVNGDGKVDLIVGNYNAPSQLYLNNGTVDPFKDVNAITLTGTNKTTSLVLGDVNGDGKLDLILGSDGAPTQLWLNNGSSTTNPFFGITPIDITTQKTVSVVLGDVNGDNKLDLVIGNFQAASQVFLNNGSNNPFSGTAQTFGSSTDATTAVALADVNGDGKLDLIRCQTGQTNSPKFTQLFLNNGTANPFSSTAINIGTGADATKSVALGDVNGDGRIDIILGNNGQPTRLFLNNGTANPFSSTAINIGTGTDTTTSLALADMNGDSKLDLILGNGKEPIRLFLNNGTATPFTGTGVNIDPTAAGNANAIATSDLNGDGKRDLVVVGAAQVPALYLNNGTADPFKDVAAKSITPESDLATQIDESALLQFSLLAAAIKADATATITVGSGAKITGSNNVKLYSNALANAQMTTIGAYLGATYASSTPTATVIIKGDGIKGANIIAGGAFDMKAIVNNTVAVSTYVPDLPTLLSTPSGGFGGDIAFSYAKGISTSIADIQKGATVIALNANVLAKNTNSFENTASAMGFQATGPLGLGVTVVLSDFQSRATTSMNGTITTTQDTTIDAQSIDTKNITRSSASVSAPKQNSDTIRSAAKGAGRGIQSLGGKLIGYGSKLQSSFLGTVGKKTLAGGGKVVNFAETSGAPSLAVSAAVTFVNSSNTADAFIGEGARVSAGGNVTVNAKAWENPQASATASAGGAEKGSVGGAVNIANFTNKANAYIGKNATVDAGATLLVNANAEVARNFQLFELNLSLPSGQPQTNDPNKGITAAWDDGQFTLGKLKTVLFDGLINPILSTSTTLGNISTTLVHSGGTVQESDGKLKEGGKAGIAGGVNILDINNGATAYIAEGAKINQNLQNPPTTQNVKVNAFAGITTLNVAGQFSTLNLALNQNVGGAGGGATGFGGSVDAITLNNAAKAYIASDAEVSASRDVEVKADTFNYHVTLAQAGSKSERLGIDGAINFVNLDNQSIAYIDTNATIKAGRNVAVNANDNLLNANGSGSLAIAGNVGIGVSAGINKINTVVRAYIGTDTPPVDPLEMARGSVTAGGDISVTANSDQKVVNISLAGAAAPGYKPPVPEDDAVANNIANLFDDSFGSAAQNPVRNKQFGFGLSGDAALNFFTPNVQAYIKNSGTIIAGQKLKINATNNSLLVATGGAFAIAKDAGIGGSFALNYLDKTTKAYIENTKSVVQILNAGSLDITADSTALVVSIAAGAAGSQQKASVAGSVNLNLLRNDTQAYLGGITNVAITQGDVLIRANNVLNTWSIAGVISGSLQGKAAVGAALDLAIIDETVKAYIGNDAFLPGVKGDIRIFAHNNDNLRSIGASFAAAGNGTGASGSVAAQILTTEVEASIGNRAIVGTQKSLRLDANDDTSVLAIGGAAAGGTTAGVGLSAAVSKVDRKVRAFIGDGANVGALGNGDGIADPQGGNIKGFGIILDATAQDRRLLFAAGVAGSTGTVAVAASTVVNLINSDTQTYIGKQASINVSGGTPNQSVRLNANHTTDILSVAGSFAGAKTAGVGAAANIENLDKKVKAYIDNASVIQAENSIILNATSLDSVLAIAAGVGGAATTGLAGSAVVHTRKTNTEAYFGDSVQAEAVGNMSIVASHEAKLKTIAGAAGFGGTGGVGASNSTVVSTDITKAYVGKASVLLALGTITAPPLQAPQVFVGGRDANSKEILSPIFLLGGMTLKALTNTDLLTIAIGGAGGGTAGVAGSATVNVLDETTHAYFDERVKFNDPNLSYNKGSVGAGGRAAYSRVNIYAGDTTKVVSSAGAIGVGLSAVGIGAGADVGTIKKNTQAYIGANTNLQATGNVFINAISNEDILSVAVNAGISTGSLAIAGGAGVYNLDITTKAFVGANAKIQRGVTAPNENMNVAIGADDNTRISLFAGTLSFAGQGVSVGAVAGVTNLVKNTLAYIDQGALVESYLKAVDDELFIPTGKFTVQYGDNSTNSADIRVPQAQINNNPYVNNANPSLLKQRSVTPQYSKFLGVSVTALNRDAIEHLVVGGSAATTGALQASGSVNVTQTNTKAFVGSNAKVNTSSLTVAAGNDFYHMGIGGTATVAGGGAFSPGADVVLVTNNTLAAIDPGAQVNATRDVSVVANAAEEINAIALGVGVAGTAAIAGSAGVISVNNKTEATVGRNAIVNASGNMLLLANDDTRTNIIAGNAAIGGKVGVGGSVGVTLITKNTQAQILQDAVVNAKGSTPMFTPTLTVFDGNAEIAADNMTTKTIKGLAVQATSSENVFTIAVAGAGGYFGGIAGAVSVELIKSNTYAGINGSKVNLDQTGAAADQTVNVGSFNQAKIFSADGSLGVAIGGGIAGSVDVGTISNTTFANITGQVNAKQDVEVNALSKQKVDSYAGSAAGGAVGIAGSVAVYTIGSILDADAQRSLQPNNSDNSATLGGYVDAQSTGSAVSTLLGQYTATGSDSNQRINVVMNQANTSLTNAAPKGQATKVLNNKEQSASTTIAYISSGSVNAGRNVNVNARNRLDMNILTGSGAAGVVAAGGSVGVVNVSHNSLAGIYTTVNAGGNINVTSDRDVNMTGKSYAGSGGLVGLGAQVMILNDTGNNTAQINGQIGQADQINVKANTTRVMDAQSIGGTVGGVVAGAAIARVNPGGITQAVISSDTRIGQEPGKSVNNFSITADDTTTTIAKARAVAAGIVSGAGADATTTINPVVSAYISSGVLVKVNNDVAVIATSQGTATANAIGNNVGGAAAGVSLARATSSPTVSSYIDSLAKINAGRDVSVKAVGSARSETTADASGGGVVSGNGADAKSTVAPKVKAYTGDNSQITAGRDVDISGTAGIIASSDGQSLNYAALTMGGAVANTEATPEETTTVGSASIIRAGNDIRLSSTVNNSNNGSIGTLNASTNSAARISARSNVTSNHTALIAVNNGAQLIAQRNINTFSLGGVTSNVSAISPSVSWPVATGFVSAKSSNTSNAVTRLGNAALNAGGTVDLTARTFPRTTNAASGGQVIFFVQTGLERNDVLQSSARLEATTATRITGQKLNLFAKSQPTFEDLVRQNRQPDVNSITDTIDGNLSRLATNLPRT